MINIVWFFALLVISSNASAFDLGGLINNDTLDTIKNAAGQKRSIAAPAGNNSKLDALSDGDVVKGLKEALSQSSSTAVSKLGAVNGFLGNEKVKIPLPSPLDKVEGAMRTFGQDKLVDDLITTMNRAAEAAVPEAKTLLMAAIKNMSVQDAKNILTGGNDAATRYFRNATESGLHTKFLPIVTKTTSKLGAAEKYNQYAGKASKLGLVDEKQASVQEYVTSKALDGLFLMMAEEEQAIRANPVERTGYWVKKVFGTQVQ